MLRTITRTEQGEVHDSYPGHIPNYVLLVRMRDDERKQLEEVLPLGYSYVLALPNSGDRRVYGFNTRLTPEQIKDITSKLVRLGTQSFEFRDVSNNISPPTRERTIRTKHPAIEGPYHVNRHNF